PQTLPQLVEALKHGNPQLEQARQAYLAARQLVPQVSSLPAPQFSLLEQANTGGPFDFNRNSGFYAYPTFTQPFLWPGKLGLAGDVAKAQAEVVGRQYDSLLLQLVAQLKLGYYQLIALQDQHRFMDEDLKRLEQIKEVAKVRYANNAAGYVDFLNAQVDASSLENDRYALDKQIQSAREQINVLLGRDSQTPLELQEQHDTPHSPSRPLAELIELAQQNNPLIAGGQAQLDAAGKSLALAHKAFWPDFAVSVGGYTDPSLVRPERSRMYALGVSLNLPSWGFRKEQAGLDQAQAQLAAAEAGQASNRQQVDLGVASAYHGLETALKQVGFTRERLLPQAQMAYRLALTGYSNNGGTQFSDLLTAQSSLRSTELALIQAENAAVQAYVSLAAAIGK
ncbi:MAG: TolC family protein, partial [Geothrix sp.]|nr:TolC family protein [Geothrix sp.]